MEIGVDSFVAATLDPATGWAVDPARETSTMLTACSRKNRNDDFAIGKSISTFDSGSIYGCLDKNGPTVEMQGLLLAIPWPRKTFCARPGKNHQSHSRNTL